MKKHKTSVFEKKKTLFKLQWSKCDTKLQTFYLIRCSDFFLLSYELFLVGLIHLDFVTDEHFPLLQDVVVQTWFAQMVVFVYDCPTVCAGVVFPVVVFKDVDLVPALGVVDWQVAKEIAKTRNTTTKVADFILFNLVLSNEKFDVQSLIFIERSRFGFCCSFLRFRQQSHMLSNNFWLPEKSNCPCHQSKLLKKLKACG